MEGSPFFEERFEPILRAETPVYQDGLLLSLLFLLFISASILILSRRDKLGVIEGAFLSFSTLQTLFVTGVVATLIKNVEGASFWNEVLHLSYLTTVFLLLRLMTYLWIWGAFSRGKSQTIWFKEYLRYFCYFGYSLYIPITLLLLNWGGVTLPLVLIVGAYTLFRAIILVRSIHIFPHLSGYPLYIILYLCTCEIAPMFFVFKEGVISFIGN